MAAMVVSGGGPVRRRGGFGDPASISIGTGPCASWGGGAGLWGLPWLVLRGSGPPARTRPGALHTPAPPSTLRRLCAAVHPR